MSRKLPAPTLDKNLRSLAGEFAVLSQLALRGIDANLTLGHTKGVDILASDARRNSLFRIEVKTRFQRPVTKSPLFGNNMEWRMSKKHESIVDHSLFYCFVDISGEKNVSRFFILPSDKVAKYVREQHVAYLKAHPKCKDNDLRVFRLAVDDHATTFPPLLARDYEDCWVFSCTV